MTSFMNEEFEDELQHIGIARRSGRYKWGSGKTPFQRATAFKTTFDELRASGMRDPEIAAYIQDYANSGDGPKVKFSTTDLRAATSISTDIIRGENVAMAVRLKDKGMSNKAIADRMKSVSGPTTNESTVRGWLKASEDAQEGSLKATAEILKGHMEDKPYLDVGKGTNLHMGIAPTKLSAAVARLRDEGYEVHNVKGDQLGTDKQTEYKILARPGATWGDTRNALLAGQVMTVKESSIDGGLTWRTPELNPVSVNSKRIQVRHADDGGAKMDGVIEVRRGVPDLDLGAKNYAQVRVAVDGTHYLKGMAMYADDLPDGVDIRYNSAKSKADAPGKLDAMKGMKTVKDDDGNPIIDQTNPFGATTRPKIYTDKNGKEKTSPLNVVNEEGDWDQWSKSLSSQMLSKQPLKLAATQLGKTQAKKQAEFDEIMSLTNPVVRKKLLEEFADSADSAAVHLKAASIQDQSTHVILPMNSMRPNEIYAPQFENGTRVALVRYPHGGPFEIPELTVNNKNLTAKRILGQATDAVGIHHTVASQLSGADFDGDTVLVIPNNTKQVKSKPPLAKLKDFNPQAEYKIPADDKTTPRMSKANTQTEMGKISNLITDMTIKGADDSEIARAVKHSMVVIDAEKHGLNYKQSEIDNGIKQLKKDYQGGANRGAATIISKASSDQRIDKVRQPSGNAGIDPATGRKVLIPTNESYVNAAGKTVMKKTKGTKMEFADDARKLMSDNPEPMEELYASHANTMKGLANLARKETLSIASPKQSAAAKAVYAKEVASLNEKLKLALSNAPTERRAQSIGNAMAQARIDAHPEYDKDDIKKVRFQSLEQARRLTGATKTKIGASEENPFTHREWEAVQAGAISSTMLREILSNAHMDRVRELATPRASSALTPGQLARAKALQASGTRSVSEIAAMLGIPRSTLSDNLK